MTSTQPPLVVDLDGTLFTGDLLHEVASAYLVHRPTSAPRLIGWLRRGKATLKAELTARASVDPEVLPYHEDLLAWLREERHAGRRLVLASASDQHVVDQVAEHLGLFDEVLGSSGGVNLAAGAKRDLLVERYGERGFDYVGNHRHDLAVWRSARTAHVVSSSPRLVAQAGEVATLGRVFRSGRAGMAGSVLRALRPHQWVKNVLVVVPLLTAQQLDDSDAVVQSLLALLTFCLAASSVYLLNDLADVANDRHHPRKRLRPFASGRLSLLVGWLLWPMLAALAFGIAAVFMSGLYVLVLASYLVATVAYTFSLKRRPVLDVVTLGGLYTVRIIAGAAAIEAPLSIWLLTFSLFFFLSLALVKRVSELARLRRTQGHARGRGYVDGDLELLSSYGVGSSIASTLVLALYVNDETTARLYETPEILWCAVPLLLVWLMRAWLIAHRGTMDEDPILYASQDRASLVTVILVGAVFVLAKVVHLQ